MSEKKNDPFSDMNRLVSMANKRLRRMERKGYKSPAYKKAMKTGGKFHNVRGASYNQKAREYQRVKNFLGEKTSTLRGSKKVLTDMLSRTGLDDAVDLDTIMTTDERELPDGSVEIVNKFFDVASKVDEYLDYHKGTKISSDEIWRSIHDTYLTGYTQEFSDVDAEEAVKKIIKKLHEDYLESTGKKHDYNTFI